MARGTTATRRAAIPRVTWSQAAPAPVVLVAGAEQLLAERAIASIRDRLRADDPALEISDLDAGDYAPGELATLASPSLFGEPRLIRVAGVERCSDAFLADALDYLESPAEGACLVLRHGGGARGKRLLDAVRAASGTAVEVVCDELKKDADKYDFARDEFRAAGKRVTPAALRALTSAFSEDLAELAAACRQLIADSSDEVGDELVDRYYGGRVETNAFKVADAAIAGRRGEALVTLRHALASGADPVPIVAAFASKLRTMAKVAGSRGSGAGLASALGLAPWQVDRARRDLQGWTQAGLGRCIEAVAEADANVKGAARDPVFALERMIATVSGRGESSGGRI